MTEVTKTVHLRQELHAKVKALAVKKSTTIKALVESALIVAMEKWEEQL